jgi:hypothetical protein
MPKWLPKAGLRDKISLAAMPFEKGRNAARKSRTDFPRKCSFFGNLSDPWEVVLKVHSWPRITPVSKRKKQATQEARANK